MDRCTRLLIPHIHLIHIRSYTLVPLPVSALSVCDGLMPWESYALVRDNCVVPSGMCCIFTPEYMHNTYTYAYIQEYSMARNA